MLNNLVVVIDAGQFF